MSEIKKNTDGQGVLVTVAGTDGAAKTSGVSFYVSKDNGSQAAAGGTAAHRGNGQWYYPFTQAETNADLIGLSWAGTDVVPGGVSLYTTTKRVQELNDLSQANAQTAAADALTAAALATADQLNTAVAALQAFIEDLQFNTRVDIVLPRVMERPDTGEGALAYKVWVNLYDSTGDMEAPDSTPTVAAANQTGTSRDANLGVVTLEGTGRYSFTYTVDDSHAMEQITLTVTVVEGGQTRVYNRATIVMDTTAVDFTTADRTKLNAIHNKLPTADYLLGTSQDDGSGYSSFNPATDTVARVTLVDQCTANDDMRGTDNAYAGTPPTAVEIRQEIDLNSTKTGYQLAITGLDLIPLQRPTGKATTFVGAFGQFFYRFFGKSTLNSETGELITYQGDGVTVATTQLTTEAGGVQTQGEAT
ncbi:hypothetical protein C5Y96_05690 [Blastopirellula marina]|uniref:Uncharacterized protein n=1 Tax=Blastopirellula marina TaxID=124 RepID=A0A2S8G4G7_9BACT|nr:MULTISPECIES: hypothetical protein [Pirellulaceae]PQO39346.1 hypothetical protein C5Y96_05690 [Blastopirellula marina]RCS55654.1 hypothetical protein DTL36_05700 [Bremerella cremea]